MNRRRTNNTKSNFEKLRFEYSVQLFDREEAIKKTLEDKASFYLSFAGIFLIAIFFKLENIKLVKEFISTKTAIKPFLCIVIFIILSSILVSVLSVLKCIQTRTYMKGFPDKLLNALFNHDSDFVKHEDSDEFYRECAKYYIVATEKNHITNKRKSLWLSICSYSSFIGICFLIALIMIIVSLNFF